MARSTGAIRRSVSSPFCWNLLSIFAVGALVFAVLASPILADEVSEAPLSESTSDDGESLTTPSTPLRRFVWRVRNWMFHREDEDTNIEVDATETTEPSNGEKTADRDGDEPRSWARSLAAWFARGIRNLLEHLYPPEGGAAEGTENGTIANPDDKPKDSDAEDSAIKPDRHVFRPWTALPPHSPPGMPTSPSDSSAESTSSASSTANAKPSTTVGSTSTSEAPISTGSSPPKKPRRRRPKPISTTTTTEMPMPMPFPSLSTEETYIQDTGNEI